MIKMFGAILAVAMVLGVVGAIAPRTEDIEHEIHTKVSRDLLDQYEILQRSGSPVERCVHAGIIAASYLQAKDEIEYQKWKKAERRDCRRAGM